jgi:hypothetical protein
MLTPVIIPRINVAHKRDKKRVEVGKVDGFISTSLVRIVDIVKFL